VSYLEVRRASNFVLEGRSSERVRIRRPRLVVETYGARRTAARLLNVARLSDQSSSKVSGERFPAISSAMEPSMAFVVDRQKKPAIEVCINFGVFAGRDATPAELDRLAAWLLDEVGEVAIISEEHRETDGKVEASVHQVRIQIANGGTDRDALAHRIVERAEYWAHLCVADRHAEIADNA
jgi:hypothetical protein